MDLGEIIYVIDQRSECRALVSKLVHSIGWHAEIFDNVAEFRTTRPKIGVVLAHHHALDSRESAVSEILPKHMFYPVILYAEDPEIETLVTAMLDGALGYLGWPITQSSLSTALEQLRASAVSHIRRQRRHLQCREQLALLTARERAVLVSLMKHPSNKETAVKLGISFRTVEVHRSNILRKLEAPTIAEATRIAVYGELDDG